MTEFDADVGAGYVASTTPSLRFADGVLADPPDADADADSAAEQARRAWEQQSEVDDSGPEFNSVIGADHGAVAFGAGAGSRGGHQDDLDDRLDQQQEELDRTAEDGEGFFGAFGDIVGVDQDPIQELPDAPAYLAGSVDEASGEAPAGPEVITSPDSIDFDLYDG
jgi:hypothetical protein